MFEQVAIIGDGQMATVMALVLAEQGVRARMWCSSAERCAGLKSLRENKRHLPGVKIPDRVSFTAEPAAAVANADLALSAVPCQYLRGVWTRFRDCYPRDVPIVSVTKGIEVDSLRRPSEILTDVLGAPPVAMGEPPAQSKKNPQSAIRNPQWPTPPVVVLSGPNIATELARRLPATMVAACEDLELACAVQRTVSTPWLRVYTNSDIIGVELAGALKNVIALAAGIIDGLGAGDNAKAALVTRGLVEICRLGVAMGARKETFAGLAGLGDLVTTCVSPSGRNRSAGEAIGRGRPVADVVRGTASVIEGIPTTRSAVALGRRYGVEMPITQAVYSVLFEGKDVIAAVGELMGRGLREED